MNFINNIEKDFIKDKKIAPFKIGDTVDVHYEIREGDKTRIQIFNGTVIAKKGSGMRASFVVRRIVQGEGVERTFFMQSPKVANVVVKRQGDVRRAKLFYLRDRTGKKTKVKELLAGTDNALGDMQQPIPPDAGQPPLKKIEAKTAQVASSGK